MRIPDNDGNQLPKRELSMSDGSSQTREISDQSVSIQNFSHQHGTALSDSQNVETVGSLFKDLQQPFQHPCELTCPDMNAQEQHQQLSQASLEQHDLEEFQNQLQQQLQIEFNRCYQQQQQQEQQEPVLQEQRQRRQFLEMNKDLLPFLNSSFAQQLLQNYVPPRRPHFDSPPALESGASPRKKVPRGRCSAVLVGPSRKLLSFQERIRHKLSQFGFPSFITLQDEEATLQRVLQQLRHLSGQCGSRDRVVIYFCGSGSQLGVSLVDGCLLYARLATILQSFETPNLCLVLDVEELMPSDLV